MNPYFWLMDVRVRWIMLLLLLAPCFVHAQQGTVKGRVKDQYNKDVDEVQLIIGDQKVAESDTNGEFRFTIDPGEYVLEFRRVGYGPTKKEISVKPGATTNVQPVMHATTSAGLEIIGRDEFTDFSDDIQTLPLMGRDLSNISNIKSDIESYIQLLPSVASNNEFSSQYRVRGGNFDENLIYVNDVEIYRPFLIRQGQQEGLGFTNANLVSDVQFSNGGFAPKYADKLSSVLDVTYRSPQIFRGTAELGILTQGFHVEGSVQKKSDEERTGRFTYLVGARHFSTSYVLKSLDTQGSYKPDFYDVQGLLNWVPKQQLKGPKYKTRKDGSIDTLYFPAERIKFSFLFNLARNNYIFTPESRETSFGTIQNVFRLFVAFEGQERTAYTTGLGAFTIEHRPSIKLRMKYIFTAFRTQESELFDVEGGYRLSDVNTNFGSDDFNEVVFDRGIGTYFNHARNYLTADVFAAEQRGTYLLGKPEAVRGYVNILDWGIRAQRQIIDDEYSEYSGVDSAGYFELGESYRTNNFIQSNLYKGYIQLTNKPTRNNTTKLIAGTRFIYNDLNGDFNISPRVQLLITPGDNIDSMKAGQNRRFQFRIAAGVYHQPPFYREMRRFDGTLNTDRPSQMSVHGIIGMNYQFKIWKRRFLLITEGFYKHLDNLVPYEVENVRLRYYPDKYAVGYAYGVDARLNGQFIRGVESWVSAGLLSTKEDVKGDTMGYVSRPTDQRFTFSMFFQDQLPFNPTFKVHIKFIYGSGLRFGPPRSFENRTAFRVPSYQRVDIGFSKAFIFKEPDEREREKGFESLTLYLEVFNLFQRANTVSYIWVKDVYNTQFAVPNFLSQRLLNFRAVLRF